MTTHAPSTHDDGSDAPTARDEAGLGQLIPWPDDEHFPNIPADEALDLYLGWVASRGVELWEHQEEALLDLAAGDHVILGTPTGSGKSLVATGLCFMACCTDRRSYYTAPIKALVSEKFFDMVGLLGRDNVGMITGDVTINPTAPIVCCTAEILANIALSKGAQADVGAVAMDEFHFFDDRERGWAWQVPLLTLPQAQFLLMSATLGDTSVIATKLEEQTGGTVDVIVDAPRPVPLSYRFVDTTLEATVKVALDADEAPLYVVHFSQDSALKSAQGLASFGVSTKGQREQVKRAVAGTRFTTGFGKTLRRLLLTGVGVHHAGMLPRYRLLVERLAQQGLLPVICGTDTLGVGINVPIHTVLLTQLTKFDGRRMRRLNAREFHQVAGRAGRAGFDSEGVVIAQATEYDIENARALAKAGGDPRRARKVRTKKPPEGFVGWNDQTFQKLILAAPETLRPRLRVTHAMVLAEVSQGGDARGRIRCLIDDSLQDAEEKLRLHARADEVLATLLDAGVIEPDATGGEGYALTVDLPDDFALDQPLSPFLLAALELLDPEDERYALDLISMVEATLEDPPQILRALEREARDRAMAQMKADGVDYDERVERIQEVSYDKPLEDMLLEAYGRYVKEVPWAADYALSCKSVLRDMVETAADFKGYVQRLGIARSEGTLLRYLSDAYRVLSRTVPTDKLDERLLEVVSWLGMVVRTVDSSLVDAWAGTDEATSDAGAAPQAADAVVRDRRGLTLLVRNALFARVLLVARRDAAALGELDADWGWRRDRWRQAIDGLYEEHEYILLDGDARSRDFLSIDEGDEATLRVWHVRQMLSDSDGDRDFGIAADVDLDATQDEGAVVFSSYRVGFAEDILAAP
ncbi:RNA helicase [Olsenella sp. HMSC062G07]|uniref:DEAD/DEAH box helicase n=1 Tax=Olsenella sp. HMSC062G07 TaxID=1739330 RepID=UPI0008A22048|nr:DEAD/DEAH box helicase [Olsenella sp. HMSC062G07]OFK23565.1 DEAD/DEAH box helicase [Olsenella sp. HMSC062G07]